MDDAAAKSEGHVVTRIVHQPLLFLGLGLSLMFHLLVVVMVVLVSGLGRVIRWLGGWRMDLGMGMSMDHENARRRLKTS